MRYLAKIFLGTLLAALVSGACGDGGEKGDPCERATALEEDAASEFCADKTEYCCLCACWQQTAGHHDVDALLESGACECTTPPPDENATDDPACEGAALEAAEACLDDEEACVQPLLQSMDVICEGSVF